LNFKRDVVGKIVHSFKLKFPLVPFLQHIVEFGDGITVEQAEMIPGLWHCIALSMEGFIYYRERETREASRADHGHD